jgi:aminopeptidase N
VGYGIYNKSQEVLALAGWFPILAVYDEDGWNLDPVSAIGDSVYSETALFDVEVTTASALVLVSSGVETSIQEESGRVQRHLVSGPVRDFFMIMSPDYQKKSVRVDGVLINSYFLPDSTRGGVRALAVASQALELYNRRYGSYPYGELDIVEAPLMYAQGVEFPTIVLIGSDLYQNSGLFFADVVAHEVAHQWWYGIVGNDVFDDPWLDEGLAVFSDGLYLEETVGRAAYSAFIRYISSEVERLVKDGMDERITESLGYFEGQNNPGIYSVIVYSKSALFFDALRKEIGDEAFFQGLQDYFRDNRYGIARPHDLLQALETAADRSLDDFYAPWLDSDEDE